MALDPSTGTRGYRERRASKNKRSSSKSRTAAKEHRRRSMEKKRPSLKKAVTFSDTEASLNASINGSTSNSFKSGAAASASIESGMSRRSILKRTREPPGKENPIKGLEVEPAIRTATTPPTTTTTTTTKTPTTEAIQEAVAATAPASPTTITPKRRGPASLFDDATSCTQASIYSTTDFDGGFCVMAKVSTWHATNMHERIQHQVENSCGTNDDGKGSRLIHLASVQQGFQGEVDSSLCGRRLPVSFYGTLSTIKDKFRSESIEETTTPTTSSVDDVNHNDNNDHSSIASTLQKRILPQSYHGDVERCATFARQSLQETFFILDAFRRKTSETVRPTMERLQTETENSCLQSEMWCRQNVGPMLTAEYRQEMRSRAETCIGCHTTTETTDAFQEIPPTQFQEEEKSKAGADELKAQEEKLKAQGVPTTAQHLSTPTTTTTTEEATNNSKEARKGTADTQLIVETKDIQALVEDNYNNKVSQQADKAVICCWKESCWKEVIMEQITSLIPPLGLEHDKHVMFELPENFGEDNNSSSCDPKNTADDATTVPATNDSARTDGGQTNGGQTDSSQTDGAQANSVQTDSAQANSVQTDSAQTDSSHNDMAIEESIESNNVTEANDANNANETQKMQDQPAPAEETTDDAEETKSTGDSEARAPADDSEGTKPIADDPPEFRFAARDPPVKLVTDPEGDRPPSDDASVERSPRKPFRSDQTGKTNIFVQTSLRSSSSLVSAKAAVSQERSKPGDMVSSAQQSPKAAIISQESKEIESMKAKGRQDILNLLGLQQDTYDGTSQNVVRTSSGLGENHPKTFDEDESERLSRESASVWKKLRKLSKKQRSHTDGFMEEEALDDNESLMTAGTAQNPIVLLDESSGGSSNPRVEVDQEEGIVAIDDDHSQVSALTSTTGKKSSAGNSAPKSDVMKEHLKELVDDYLSRYFKPSDHNLSTEEKRSRDEAAGHLLSRLKSHMEDRQKMKARIAKRGKYKQKNTSAIREEKPVLPGLPQTIERRSDKKHKLKKAKQHRASKAMTAMEAPRTPVQRNDDPPEVRSSLTFSEPEFHSSRVSPAEFHSPPTFSEQEHHSPPTFPELEFLSTEVPDQEPEFHSPEVHYRGTEFHLAPNYPQHNAMPIPKVAPPIPDPLPAKVQKLLADPCKNGIINEVPLFEPERSRSPPRKLLADPNRHAMMDPNWDPVQRSDMSVSSRSFQKVEHQDRANWNPTQSSDMPVSRSFQKVEHQDHANWNPAQSSDMSVSRRSPQRVEHRDDRHGYDPNGHTMTYSNWNHVQSSDMSVSTRSLQRFEHRDDRYGSGRAQEVIEAESRQDDGNSWLYQDPRYKQPGVEEQQQSSTPPGIFREPVTTTSIISSRIARAESVTKSVSSKSSRGLIPKRTKSVSFNLPPEDDEEPVHDDQVTPSNASLSMERSTSTTTSSGFLQREADIRRHVELGRLSKRQAALLSRGQRLIQNRLHR